MFHYTFFDKQLNKNDAHSKNRALTSYLLSACLLSSLVGASAGYSIGVGSLEPETSNASLAGASIGMGVYTLLLVCSCLHENFKPQGNEHFSDAFDFV